MKSKIFIKFINGIPTKQRSMDLQLNHKKFVVIGASSGFGKAVSKLLIADGAKVIAVARDVQKLTHCAEEFGPLYMPFQGDITSDFFQQKLIEKINAEEVHGILLNSSGPPARKFLETTLNDWDQAYAGLLRWKVALLKELLPYFAARNYGRLVFIESATVKQPLDNLILSSSLRLSVVGLVKSISNELQSANVTLNIMGPGYHDTSALDRLFSKYAEDHKCSYDEAKFQMMQSMPMKSLGNPNDFAALACYLLSPLSAYISGQCFSVDGKVIKGIF